MKRITKAIILAFALFVTTLYASPAIPFDIAVHFVLYGTFGWLCYWMGKRSTPTPDDK